VLTLKHRAVPPGSAPPRADGGNPKKRRNMVGEVKEKTRETTRELSGNKQQREK